MNKKLTEEIVYHIFANLGILPSDHTNITSMQSIIDKKFLLAEKIKLETEDKVISNNIYGCQISISDNKDFKILLADCSQDSHNLEYGVLIQLKDSPAFGLYLSFHLSEVIDREALIAVNIVESSWVPCNTYLQATFLAGMEQIKDLGFGWIKCSNYNKLYHQLLSFIKFHHNFYRIENEGQES